jgi:hypothetical protein
MKNNIKKKKNNDLRLSGFVRAVEKNDRDPQIIWGQILDDTGTDIILFGAHDGDSSILKERLLKKGEFYFKEIDFDEFEINARRGLFKMKEELNQRQFEYEKHAYQTKFAEDKLEQIKALST